MFRGTPGGCKRYRGEWVGPRLAFGLLLRMDYDCAPQHNWGEPRTPSILRPPETIVFNNYEGYEMFLDNFRSRGGRYSPITTLKLIHTGTKGSEIRKIWLIYPTGRARADI